MSSSSQPWTSCTGTAKVGLRGWTFQGGLCRGVGCESEGPGGVRTGLLLDQLLDMR